MNATQVLVLPHLPSTLELTGRIVLAAFLGGLIGLERELNDHPSGLRTHVTVAIGAALFGIASAYAFREFVAVREGNNYQIDVTRVASQVVVGVGFLGGGAIIKQGNSVRGLTSAAGLWVSAAVGLAVALGLWVEAFAAVITLVASLTLLKTPRRWLRERFSHLQEVVAITIGLDADPSQVISALGAMPDTRIRSLIVKRRDEENVTVIEAEIQARGGTLQNLLAVIEGRPDVLGIEVST